ncbi:Heterokaryon incompatibility protein (HET) domain containing protein [Hyaloscypha variabilis]
MAKTAHYTYTPLAPNSIRTLTLLPGTGREQLKFTLNEVDLNDHPAYDAISYVWGDEVDPYPIFCDGQDRSLPITQNLAAALFRFRRADKQRVLWADAVCINQQDIAERGHQVQLMGRVYNEASCVLIWLGEEDEHTELVSACVHSPFLNLTNEETLALKLFLGRPWFHRAWTFQESVLATSAEIHCGSYLFSKKIIYDAIYRNLDVSSDARSAEPESADYRRLSKTMSVRESWLTYDFSIAELLISRRGSQCKDPLDLVYSLLGVASDISEIEPDYTKSVQEVFAAITRHIMTTTQSLSILTEVNTKKFDDSFPSWVPDWRERKLETAFSRLRMDPGDTGVWKWKQLPIFRAKTVDDATKFSLQGADMDEIQDPVDAEDLDAVLNLFIRTAGPNHDTYTGASPSEEELQLIRTIALDAPYREFFGRLGSLRYKIESKDVNHASLRSSMERFKRTSKGEKFFYSRLYKIMGIGPERCQEGDIICRIRGFTWPILLRPIGNEFLFVGHCFAIKIYPYGQLNTQEFILR